MKERLENQRHVRKYMNEKLWKVREWGGEKWLEWEFPAGFQANSPTPLDQHCSSHISPALLGFQGSMGPVPVIWPKSPLLLTAQASGEPCRFWFPAWDLEWWSCSSVDPSLFCLILPLPPFLPPALLLPPPAILKCPLIGSQSTSQIILCLFCKW